MGGGGGEGEQPDRGRGRPGTRPVQVGWGGGEGESRQLMGRVFFGGGVWRSVVLGGAGGGTAGQC